MPDPHDGVPTVAAFHVEPAFRAVHLNTEQRAYLRIAVREDAVLVHALLYRPGRNE